MMLRDLIVDPGTGQLSHTKVWSNIAYLTTTAAFGLQAWTGTLDAEIWLIYLGVVGAHGSISKWISLKYGGRDE
jgi:hypothetical protein